jgi:hypothetical protein
VIRERPVWRSIPAIPGMTAERQDMADCGHYLRLRGQRLERQLRTGKRTEFRQAAPGPHDRSPGVGGAA